MAQLPRRPFVKLFRRLQWRNRAYTYHLMTAVPTTDDALVPMLTDLCYHGDRFRDHPWYPTQLWGAALPAPLPTGDPRVREHQLSIGLHDIGFKRPRSFLKLVSHAAVGTRRRIVVKRSIAWGSHPAQAVAAYLLAPSGDVVCWTRGWLRWHHFVTTRGFGTLPERLDRKLIYGMRVWELDIKERTAYHHIGWRWCRFARDGRAVKATHDQLKRMRARYGQGFHPRPRHDYGQVEKRR